ncbi:arginase family protein [Psychrobium sp. 1_MG-2023]|uniref:arginase family protein n=1 Tax=Psychrobium sp. 1_MG-2023 TaxID=3062624 RepID=UPI000C34CA10|nr:arginase family protein [Psychrobium sp. 1_MG-2023]MDP2562752.1 arginase family protein [Psychrobium sp. 1_MG-2023]PKF57681.1 arginase [Alteromonadales bacterium alter-6D02]
MADWSNFSAKINQYLCPPGNGVFTVNTAKERKESLHKSLYGNTDNIELAWSEQVSQLPLDTRPVVLGVCSDTGGGILRGANWGPLFLRQTMLSDDYDVDYFDVGDVRVIPHLLHDKYLNEATITNCRKALYHNPESSLPVSALSITEDFCDEFYHNFPDKGLFAIGGDHSVSYPLARSYLRAKKAQNKKAALIHFDAHTDLLVERLGIDICFGSWVTHILDDLPSRDMAFQFGIRSSGKDRGHWEDSFGVNQYWTHEINERGAQAIVDETIVKLKANGIEELYVSFDIDALDAHFAAATGTPEPDGLNPEQALLIISELNKHFKITGADMVEIAPFLNTNEDGGNDREKTLAAGSQISELLLKALAE